MHKGGIDKPNPNSTAAQALAVYLINECAKRVAFERRAAIHSGDNADRVEARARSRIIRFVDARMTLISHAELCAHRGTTY